MDSQAFDSLVAAEYKRIPLKRTILADLETPLSVYVKLAAKQPYTYLLESVEGGETWGRYSIIGLSAEKVIKIYGNQINIYEQGRLVKHSKNSDPLQWISDYQHGLKIPEPDSSLPVFTGGLVGYFGYDSIRYIESKLAKTQPPENPELNTPDILLMVSNEVVVFDNLNGHLHLIIHADADQKDAYAISQQRLDYLEDCLQHNSHSDNYSIQVTNTLSDGIQEKDFKSAFPEKEYKAAVNKIKDYIKAGDTMQVVLSQRLSIPIKASPLNIYRILRSLNPSPYLYYMNLDDFHIVGASPEVLVRLKDNKMTVRPIAGTRPRGKTPEEDLKNEQELLADKKELAEHLMLIVLGRNDVGHIAKIGSVKLTEKMIVERYSHVMHIVSNIEGECDQNIKAMDVLRTAFPAGTLSGAPKIRAMEIIDELENVKRGIYGGAVGYLSWQGDMDTAIAIRTAIIKDDKLYIQAGAGIVADSNPQMEWDETMNKARAILKAVAKAEAALGNKKGV